MINVLFIGDVVGQIGLEFLIDNFSTLKDKYQPDFIIVNGENISNGKGLNEGESNELFDQNVDVITTGNHIWDNWKSRPLLAKNDRVIRPYNYPPGNTGRGYVIVDSPKGKIAVLQLQGKVFMQPIDCPFRGADYAIKKINEETDIIIVDFHADATAEKMAMGWHLDGRASAMIGTHTHIQTADASILPNGTAYISDTGMTGPYDSVVGMRKDIALKRFVLQTAHKYEMADSDLKICGTSVTIDPSTGQAMKIDPFCFPDFIREVIL